MHTEPSIFGLAAEFLTPEELLHAATAASAAGYRRAEAFTPFPIKGLAETLGFRRTWLPAICLAGGIGGTLLAYLVCWYADVISYPWNIGNRPLNSWPALLAIIADVAIAGAFFCVLAAMFIFNELPRWNHPLFNVDEFSRATLDRYFLCIECTDPHFDADTTRNFLITLQPAAIYAVPE